MLPGDWLALALMVPVLSIAAKARLLGTISCWPVTLGMLPVVAATLVPPVRDEPQALVAPTIGNPANAP